VERCGTTWNGCSNSGRSERCEQSGRPLVARITFTSEHRLPPDWPGWLLMAQPCSAVGCLLLSSAVGCVGVGGEYLCGSYRVVACHWGFRPNWLFRLFIYLSKYWWQARQPKLQCRWRFKISLPLSPSSSSTACVEDGGTRRELDPVGDRRPSTVTEDLLEDGYPHQPTFFEKATKILLLNNCLCNLGVPSLLDRSHSWAESLPALFVVDRIDVTSKTRGYGGMPIQMAQEDGGRVDTITATHQRRR
jgi:hypothetical protein